MAEVSNKDGITEDALKDLLDAVCNIREAKPLDLYHACGRVLAQDVRTDIDQPPYDTVGRDGSPLKRGTIAIAGDVMLRKGQVLEPEDIGILADCGVVMPLVYRKPRAGILSVGDTLVESHIPLKPPKVRDSHAFKIYAKLQKEVCVPEYLGIAGNELKTIEQKVSSVRLNFDFILLLGGSPSLILELCESFDDEKSTGIISGRSLISREKPFIYKEPDHTYLFGLSNDQYELEFEEVVKPFIRKLAGMEA